MIAQEVHPNDFIPKRRQIMLNIERQSDKLKNLRGKHYAF